jgi:hypothetical protein
MQRTPPEKQPDGQKKKTAALVVCTGAPEATNVDAHDRTFIPPTQPLPFAELQHLPRWTISCTAPPKTYYSKRNKNKWNIYSLDMESELCDLVVLLLLAGQLQTI